MGVVFFSCIQHPQFHSSLYASSDVYQREYYWKLMVEKFYYKKYQHIIQALSSVQERHILSYNSEHLSCTLWVPDSLYNTVTIKFFQSCTVVYYSILLIFFFTEGENNSILTEAYVINKASFLVNKEHINKTIET